MSLLISGDLRLRNQLPADAEADAYIAAVEAADGQALEPGVKFAIKNFVLCCKQDGIWTAIKASCILAGARTLSGALVPLVGTAPTNVNFVSGDYNRETGLVGNGSTKYLNSNRNNNADPQNSQHNAVYISTLQAGAYLAASGAAQAGTNLLGGTITRSRSASESFAGGDAVIGLFAINRGSSADYTVRNNKSSFTATVASSTPENALILLYRRGDSGSPAYTSARLAFYSIGESLDLALLDARVTDLINAFGAAIP